jgi:hypothetical protein
LKNQQQYQSWGIRSERTKKRNERRLQKLEEKVGKSSDIILSETSLCVDWMTHDENNLYFSLTHNVYIVFDELCEDLKMEKNH